MADANALRGGPATARVLSGASMPAGVNTIQADYAAGTGVLQVVDGLYGDLGALQAGMASVFSALSARAKNTLLAMYLIDAGLSAQAPLAQLTAADVTTALKVLIAQMTAASASVNASAPAAGAQTAISSPNGNPVLVLSVKDNKGVLLQYCFPETLTFAVTGDSQGSSTLGNEPFSVKGQPSVSDVFSHLWPGGSGTQVTLNAVDGSKSYPAAGNLLVNSDFTVFTTANSPDNWNLVVGAAGTDIFNGTAGGAYSSGGGALQFTGTGAALLDAVTQSFGTASSTAVGAGGTPAVLTPDTVYAVNLWLKCSATPAAGVFEVALVDGSGTVINDDAATANLATRTLTTISTTYVNFNTVFRTPAVLPASLPIKLRLRLSTAIDSGKSAYLGRVAFAAMTPLYQGGPYFQVFSGNARVITGDSWTVALTQTMGGFQSWLERVFGLKALGLTIPSSGSPTIADSLIA